MQTNNTPSKSKLNAKRNPSPEASAAVWKALNSSPATSFGFHSKTRGTAKKVPIDGVNISSRHVCDRLIEQAVLTDPLRTKKENDLRFVEVIAMFRELQPRNALEAMLGAQIIGTHNLIMESQRRATLSEVGSAETNRVVRLTKVFLEQVETLERLRGKFARQHLTVKHIHVEAGARAVVGVVQVEGSKQVKGSKDE
jgi:hypothetical protein